MAMEARTPGGWYWGVPLNLGCARYACASSIESRRSCGMVFAFGSMTTQAPKSPSTTRPSPPTRMFAACGHTRAQSSRRPLRVLVSKTRELVCLKMTVLCTVALLFCCRGRDTGPRIGTRVLCGIIK